MKIVHIGFSHRWDDIRIFHKECRSLATKGYEVIYITSNRYAEGITGIYDNVKIIVIKLISAGRIKRIFKYYKELKNLIINLDADIYHFHEIELIPVLAFAIRKKKKVIYDLHEDSPRQLNASLCKKYGVFLGKLLTKLIEKYENLYIKKSHYIIAATPHILERCEKINDNVMLIANYPIIHDNSNDEYLPFLKREKKVCYTGGISETNGIFNIIKAMSSVNGELYLAGDLSDELYNNIKNYPGWLKVYHLGYIDRNRVKKLLLECVAGLVIYKPSGNTIEALPNKMFEYMEVGLPVIASDFPLWKKIIERNKCGICVNPLDPDEISNAINFMLDNPDKAEKMGQNGKEMIKASLNWANEEVKLLKFYEEIR